MVTATEEVTRTQAQVAVSTPARTRDSFFMRPWDAIYREVPPAERFESDGRVVIELFPAHDLASAGARMIGALKGFDHLAGKDVVVHYFWKRTGGSAGGSPVWGGTRKPDAFDRHYADGVSLQLWLAADHIRNAELTTEQVEALLFHYLKRAGKSEDGGIQIVRPDVEVFYDELAEYGAWRTPLRDVEKLLARNGQYELDLDGRANGHADSDEVEIRAE